MSVTPFTAFVDASTTYTIPSGKIAVFTARIGLFALPVTSPYQQPYATIAYVYNRVGGGANPIFRLGALFLGSSLTSGIGGMVQQTELKPLTASAGDIIGTEGGDDSYKIILNGLLSPI